MAWGLTAAIILSLSLGWRLGLAAHATAEDLATAQEARKRTDNFISEEVNRTLLELWRMEDVEAGRARGSFR